MSTFPRRSPESVGLTSAAVAAFIRAQGALT